jgi:hypothetical protein
MNDGTSEPFRCPAQGCHDVEQGSTFGDAKRFYLHWCSTHKPRCPRTDCKFSLKELSKTTESYFLRHWTTHFPELKPGQIACAKCGRHFANTSNRDRHAIKCVGGTSGDNRVVAEEAGHGYDLDATLDAVRPIAQEIDPHNWSGLIGDQEPSDTSLLDGEHSFLNDFAAPSVCVAGSPELNPNKISCDKREKTSPNSSTWHRREKTCEGTVSRRDRLSIEGGSSGDVSVPTNVRPSPLEPDSIAQFSDGIDPALLRNLLRDGVIAPFNDLTPPFSWPDDLSHFPKDAGLMRTPQIASSMATMESTLIHVGTEWHPQQNLPGSPLTWQGRNIAASSKSVASPYFQLDHPRYLPGGGDLMQSPQLAASFDDYELDNATIEEFVASTPRPESVSYTGPQPEDAVNMHQDTLCQPSGFPTSEVANTHLQMVTTGTAGTPPSSRKRIAELETPQTVKRCRSDVNDNSQPAPSCIAFDGKLNTPSTSVGSLLDPGRNKACPTNGTIAATQDSMLQPHNNSVSESMHASTSMPFRIRKQYNLEFSSRQEMRSSSGRVIEHRKVCAVTSLVTSSTGWHEASCVRIVWVHKIVDDIYNLQRITEYRDIIDDNAIVSTKWLPKVRTDIMERCDHVDLHNLAHRRRYSDSPSVCNRPVR